jgi:hypothetical protein
LASHYTKAHSGVMMGSGYPSSKTSGGGISRKTSNFDSAKNRKDSERAHRMQALNSLGNREITELPIYQLLRAFNLQQYTRVGHTMKFIATV